MIKSQNCPKLIQKKIEEKSNDFTSKLYDQIKYNLLEIINDRNYVIQKLVEHCDKKTISSMIKIKYYSSQNMMDNNNNNFIAKKKKIIYMRYYSKILQREYLSND